MSPDPALARFIDRVDPVALFGHDGRAGGDAIGVWPGDRSYSRHVRAFCDQVGLADAGDAA